MYKTSCMSMKDLELQNFRFSSTSKFSLFINFLILDQR